METFKKKPLEDYPISVEFEGKLPISTDELNPIIIASGVFSAINIHTGLDVTTDLFPDPIAVIDVTRADTFIQGGILGDDYLITCLVDLSPGSPTPTLQEDIVMYVRDTLD